MEGTANSTRKSRLVRAAASKVLLASVFLACGGAESPPPVGARSVEPNLFAARDGRVLMSWMEPTEGGHALRASVRANGEWSDARTIATDRDFFVNWADFPSIVETQNGTWLVHWLEKVGPSTYAYHVMVSSSEDGGETWSEPRRLHTDESPTEHGFVSMLPMPDGQTVALWLDGQNTGGGHEGGGAMQLRSAFLGTGGTTHDEVLVDDMICDCCQTALVRAGTAVVAAYRDRSEGEIRDVAVRRYHDGQWSEPVHVGPDRWVFPACPVNGPALAARGDTVAIAWFAAPNDSARVSVAFSTDGGRTFGNAIRVDDGAPLGRVDIEIMANGVVAMWLERAGTDGAVRARHVSWSGETNASQLIAETSQARSSGFPRMAATTDGVLVAWTDVDTGVRVRDGLWREWLHPTDTETAGTQ